MAEENKEGVQAFKLQFWKLFILTDWFKILMNNTFSHKDSMNGYMQLNAHKKCLPFNTDLEPLFLAQWLWDNASLTTQPVEETIKPYTVQCAQHYCSVPHGMR